MFSVLKLQIIYVASFATIRNSHGFAGVRKALRECQSPVCILPNC